MTALHDDCAPVLAQVQAFVDGELGMVECAGIERHCARCPSCAAVVRGLRQTIGLCREAGRAPLPDAIARRARAQIRRLLANPRERG